MAKKIRKDIRVGALEKKLGVAPGTITNPDGSDARSDKKLETLQKEFTKAKPKTAKKSSAATNMIKKRPKISPDLLVTVDQKAAARRTVKSNPKTSTLVKKLSAAVKKTSSK
ncbi:hypothetical protein [Mucilaginibacter sp.]